MEATHFASDGSRHYGSAGADASKCPTCNPGLWDATTTEIHVYDWPIESALMENAMAQDLHESPETWSVDFAWRVYEDQVQDYYSVCQNYPDPGPAIAMTYQWRREAR